MLSKVKSFKVFIKYCTSIIIDPFLLTKLNIHSAISLSLSEWAKTFEANIKSAFFLIFLRFFFSKKPLKVFILFLFASLARFLAGSIPRTFLNPRSMKGLRAIPSLLPMSMIYEFFLFNLSSLEYFFAAYTKWSLKILEVDDVYK